MSSNQPPKTNVILGIVPTNVKPNAGIKPSTGTINFVPNPNPQPIPQSMNTSGLFTSSGPNTMGLMTNLTVSHGPKKTQTTPSTQTNQQPEEQNQNISTNQQFNETKQNENTQQEKHEENNQQSNQTQQKIRRTKTKQFNNSIITIKSNYSYE